MHKYNYRPHSLFLILLLIGLHPFSLFAQNTSDTVFGYIQLADGAHAGIKLYTDDASHQRIFHQDVINHFQTGVRKKRRITDVTKIDEKYQTTIIVDSIELFIKEKGKFTIVVYCGKNVTLNSAELELKDIITSNTFIQAYQNNIAGSIYLRDVIRITPAPPEGKYPKPGNIRLKQSHPSEMLKK